MPFVATYDEFMFETNDPVFYESITNGTTEPYPIHLAIVKKYLTIFPNKNRCYVDVGAHIGTTIAAYSRLFSEIHGYEPNTKTFELLKKNITKNKIACNIHNVGLYSEACRGDVHQHAGGNSGCYFFKPSESGSITCIPLDVQNHQRVDFMKLDTEGSELFVLKGAEQTIRKWKPLIQVETNEWSDRLYGVSRKDILAYLKTLGYIEFDTSDPNNIFMYCPELEEKLTCFWMSPTPMSSARELALQSIYETTGLSVKLLNLQTFKPYILQAHPLHPAFQFLSDVHKSDYLRTYFMNFYGGGYTDIKQQTGSWKSAYNQLLTTDAYIVGYSEKSSTDIAYTPVSEYWNILIGNGAYICKPNTPLTNEWYSEMISLLDKKLNELQIHPAIYPRDAKEHGTGYPIEWNEMLGRIFHKVCFKYTEKILRCLPDISLHNYM